MDQDNKDEKPTQVVIVIPPLYLDRDLAQQIKEKTQADTIEIDWSEGKPIKGKKNVALVHDFPKISNAGNLAKNTFFVIAGFNKEALKNAIDQVNTISRKEDPSQNNQIAEKFTQNITKNSVDEMWPEYEKFFENIQKVLPNNYMLVQTIKIDDIMQGLDLGFVKLSIMT